MDTPVPPLPGSSPQPIKELDPLHQISKANGRSHEVPIPDDLHGLRPQGVDSEAAPLSEHELAKDPPHDDATVEPTKSLRDDIWNPTKKAQVPAEEAPPPENTPVPGKNEKVSEEPGVGRDFSFEEPKPNEDYGVVLPKDDGALPPQKEGEVLGRPPLEKERPLLDHPVEEEDRRIEPIDDGEAPAIEEVEDDSPLQYVISEILTQEDTGSPAEASAATVTDPESPLAYVEPEIPANIKEAKGPLSRAASLATSADYKDIFAKEKAMAMALPEVEEKLKTMPPKSKIAEKYRASISEIKKNRFECQANGCKISGTRNGLIFIYGDPANVNALLENPEAFLSAEDCTLLRDACDRDQLRCLPLEEEEGIEEMAKEYADQYMQDLERQIQQEIADLEQKAQQKKAAKMPDLAHAKPQVMEGKREELRLQRPEMTPLESLADMAHESRILLETAITEKRREKDREAKEELREMDERYWNTLEYNRKNAIRIFDSEIREAQKRDSE